ncbi:hypothetical protein DFJ73DRAFT_779770 [Zopfochytrium polystomum]|nr:hypothetical protein DFJ73DRAFT_779770 [Zopfochytrium polystomum]
MRLIHIAAFLLVLVVAGELAVAKNCVWTNVGITKDIFVWDDSVSVWQASNYWNWHYDHLDCFKNTWQMGNGGMKVGINDGTRSIGFYYFSTFQGTSPDTCFTNSCQFVDTGGRSLTDNYLPDRGWRVLNYCTLNRLSCLNENTVLKTGEPCTCSNGQLIGDKCINSGWFGLSANTRVDLANLKI